jgi:hypothetical protein
VDASAPTGVRMRRSLSLNGGELLLLNSMGLTASAVKCTSMLCLSGRRPRMHMNRWPHHFFVSVYSF